MTAPSTVLAGDSPDIDVVVKNVGNQDVPGNITVTLNDDTAGIEFGSEIGSGLNAGAAALLTFTWDTNGAGFVDHTLTASHDLAADTSTNDTAITVPS